MDAERRDYAILTTYLMREEAEVAASALRAEGVDAFVSPGFHAAYNWHYVIALGGLKIFVPFQKLEEARDIIRQRLTEAAEEPITAPEEALVKRRDRYKVWLVIGGYLGVNALGVWISQQASTSSYQAPAAPAASYYSVPEVPGLTELQAALLDYCRDYPSDRVSVPDGDSTRLMECADILPWGQPQ